MQLTSIRCRMGLASCALLQAGAHAATDADGWDVDTAMLIYSEADGRVSALEPAIHASGQHDDNSLLDLRLVVDVLTGATPNGAHASSVAQTFTTPSGSSSYSVAPGQTPLDNTFRDVRYALGADWTLELERTQRVVLGLNLSAESDYQSIGVSSSYLRDFNQRNTTLTLGLAYNSDSISRNTGENEDEGGASATVSAGGGTPRPFSPMITPVTTAAQLIPANPDGSKDIVEFIVGVTQVIDARTLVQLNISMGRSNGYHNDPYKILTVVDPLTGLPDNSALLNINSNALSYVFENRPDLRQRNTVFIKGVRALGDDVLHLSYRYFSDDWGIRSHTLDLRYRYPMQQSYWQPHVRYYTQSAADFYRHHLVNGVDVDATGNVLIDYASNDYRLAPSDTITLGLKYGKVTGDGEMSFRVEWITQKVDNSGVPAGEETPDLNAIVLQANYSFLW